MSQFRVLQDTEEQLVVEVAPNTTTRVCFSILFPCTICMSSVDTYFFQRDGTVTLRKEPWIGGAPSVEAFKLQVGDPIHERINVTQNGFTSQLVLMLENGGEKKMTIFSDNMSMGAKKRVFQAVGAFYAVHMYTPPTMTMGLTTSGLGHTALDVASPNAGGAAAAAAAHQHHAVVANQQQLILQQQQQIAALQAQQQAMLQAQHVALTGGAATTQPLGSSTVVQPGAVNLESGAVTAATLPAGVEGTGAGLPPPSAPPVGEGAGEGDATSDTQTLLSAAQ